jgi:hypothetical protein
MNYIEEQLKNLKTKLKSKIDDALRNEVAEIVTETMLSNIKTEVYDAYNPKRYERRYDDGGIVDEGNIVSKVKGNTLTVENITMSNKEYLPKGEKPFKIAGVIEHGSGAGYGEYDYYDPGARPFLEETRNDLIKNKQHIDAIKKGLKRQGIDVVD